MKVAIVGSRGFMPLGTVAEFIAKLPSGTVVVSGGAKGVDQIGAQMAKRLGLPSPEIYLPDWEAHGKSAGMIRNRTIVEASDVVVAFWDGKSSGTANTIGLGKEANKPVFIVDQRDPESWQDIFRRALAEIMRPREVVSG